MYVIEHHHPSQSYFVVDALTGRIDNLQHTAPRPYLTRQVAQARADELNAIAARNPVRGL